MYLVEFSIHHLMYRVILIYLHWFCVVFVCTRSRIVIEKTVLKQRSKFATKRMFTAMAKCQLQNLFERTKSTKNRCSKEILDNRNLCIYELKNRHRKRRYYPNGCEQNTYKRVKQLNNHSDKCPNIHSCRTI